ncbi:MAG: hypothetical protein ACLFTP_05055 [Rhodosalinus sp.]|uniref:hypothetical protein n=1 Tax=Rhodosalinus sp. TaxID=2047741 RepID=UPI00397DC1D9
MRDSPPGRVEDYTGTCLVLFFVNLFGILTAVMVAFGWPAVLLVAGALHVAIDWLGRRRDAKDAGLAAIPGIKSPKSRTQKSEPPGPDP